MTTLPKCTKCGRLFCEELYGGVCTSDMSFCSEPTADGDAVASYLRTWYEANRERWYQRRTAEWHSGFADEFMLSLISEVHRIEAERARQTAKSMTSTDVELSREIWRDTLT